MNSKNEVKSPQKSKINTSLRVKSNVEYANQILSIKLPEQAQNTQSLCGFVTLLIL